VARGARTPYLHHEHRRIAAVKETPMQDDLRLQLTPADYLAAGVEAPKWEDDPVPSLETWRRWQAADTAALAHKAAKTAKISA
jgi:hypothetical protein